jgi:CII-binding regulator of phage lambda lysogenization HflD
MNNGHNQDDRTRLDRVEAIVEALANNQDKMQDDMRILLRSQVFISETLDKFGKSMQQAGERIDQLAQAQQHTDERLNVLIGYFQRQPQEHCKRE